MTVYTEPLPLTRPATRSFLLSGLRLALRHPGALLWTYIANLGLALLFSLHLRNQLGTLLDHSFAAERLNSAFDLGVLGAASLRLSEHVPSAGISAYSGLPVYLLLYFLLVPGALFCFRAGAPTSLRRMLSAGFCFFWRFVRITLLTALVSAIILGPLLALQTAWSTHVTENVVGESAFLHRMVGWAIILLVAAFLRLYFDLVEVYTVQLDEQVHPNGKPDRRVRRTLLPALRTLWRNFGQAYFSFLLITLFGLLAVFVCARAAFHTLAEPRTWPQFLLLQLGLILNLLARYWQRGGETILAADFPLAGTPVWPAARPLEPSCTVAESPAFRPVKPVPPYVAVSVPPTTTYPAHPPADPIPGPEPPVPPLSGPAYEHSDPLAPPVDPCE